MTILALGLLAQGFFVSNLQAETIFVTDTGDSVEVVEIEQRFEMDAGSRDSLMVEIRRYSKIVAAMQDSLSREGGGFELSEDDRHHIEHNIAEVSEVIEHIGVELSQLEFEIKNNTISLVNESGEGIIINIPENLDQHLSEGLEILTQVILSELPDSIDFDHSEGWDWSGFAPDVPPPPRKVVQGNIIKVWDDLQVPVQDDVRGNVVVVFGDSEISGRVDGTVVVVFGNLLLSESAEVTGNIVQVGGWLDQDVDATVSDIITVDMWPGDGDGSLLGFLGQGILPFLMCQGTFLLTVLLSIVAVLAAPRVRFEAITETLRLSPGPSLGLGLVAALVGQLVVAVLMAVLILTVIGIPLALLVFVALVIVIIVSIAVTGVTIGQVICRRIGSGCSSPWLTVVLGLSVLHIISFLGSVLTLSPGLESLANIFVVCGMFIKTMAFLFGLGAVVVSRYGSQKPA